MMISRSTAGIALGLCALLAVTPGCGTMFGYAFDTTIKVNSEPGAMVLLDGNQVGTAPCEFKLGYDKSSYRLTIRKEGFQDAGLSINRKMSVNILMLDVGLSFFTFCVPLIVDGALDGWYYYPEKDFNLPLRPLVAQAAAPSPAPAIPAEPDPAPGPATTSTAEARDPLAAGGEAATPAQPAVKFCGDCGEKLESTAAFCGECGARQ